MRTFTRYFAGSKTEVEKGIKETLRPWISIKDATIKQTPGDNRLFATVVFEEESE